MINFIKLGSNIENYKREYYFSRQSGCQEIKFDNCRNIDYDIKKRSNRRSKDDVTLTINAEEFLNKIGNEIDCKELELNKDSGEYYVKSRKIWDLFFKSKQEKNNEIMKK